MIVTKEYIHKNKSPKGAWSRKQLAALGVDWPPAKGGKNRVIGNVIDDQNAAVFECRGKAKKGE